MTQAATTDLRQIHRPPEQHTQGEGLSRALGEGLDFAEARLYQPGDPVRHLDWRVTARTGKPHVRCYHEEHQAAWILVLEGSPGMAFGTRKRLKWTQAIRLAIYLQSLAIRLDLHSRLLFDDGAQGLQTDHAASVAEVLALGAQGLRVSAPRHASLQASLAPLLQHPAGATVWWLTEVRPWSLDDKHAIEALAQHHHLHAIRVQDPGENWLPPDAGLRLADLRGHLTPDWLSDGRAETVLPAAFATALAAQNAHLAACGAMAYTLSTVTDDLRIGLWHG